MNQHAQIETAPKPAVSDSSDPVWREMIESLLPTELELERWFDQLWPICRSLTGEGFRQSLGILSEIIPYEKFEMPTGTRVFDWTIPKEWNIEAGWIENERGERVVDFADNNLHVLGYSTPVDQWLTLDELQPHLYSLPEQPEAIPYLTSYYRERWGFCLTERQRTSLATGRYRAVIKSTLKSGSLTFGHHILPSTRGDSSSEILLSSYLCHPSMANNELSGPLAMTYVAAALQRVKNRRFTYRFVIVPETIGAIAYLSQFGGRMKERTHAGYVVTCCGDNHAITYKKSRDGNTITDRITLHELAQYGKPYEVVEFFPSGSDERQYCSPGFNLPVGSLMRSMYGRYPEYHTSLDNKSFLSFGALRESISLYLRMQLSIEANRVYRTLVPYGEPQLGPRGLYPSLGSQKQTSEFVDRMMWLLNQSDGTNDLCAIAAKANCSVLDLAMIADLLVQKQLLTVEDA
jgi:aminopeptidase-like protein